MNNIENNHNQGQAVCFIENDKTFAEPWKFVKNRLIEKAGVPNEHLNNMTVELAVFLDDLYCAGNIEAVQKLANNRTILYENKDVYDLFVANMAVFMLNHFGDPKNVPNVFINDREKFIDAFNQVLHYGDFDYYTHHEMLKGLKVQNETVDTA